MFIFVVKLIQKFLKKESKSNCWSKLLSIAHLILTKLMIFFTFALYIRIILKANQYILTSWISEIYHFDYYGSKRIVSIAVAFLTLIAWLVLIIATIVLALSKSAFSYPDSPEKIEVNLLSYSTEFLSTRSLDCMFHCSNFEE